MRTITTRVALATTFTLFVASLATALPHGDESMDMGMDMNPVTDVPQPTTPTMQNNTAGAMSYFAYSKHSSTIIAHIALMVLGWCFVLPVGKWLSCCCALNAKQRKQTETDPSNSCYAEHCTLMPCDSITIPLFGLQRSRCPPRGYL
jgi:Domain of unknown function (DUF2427).